jgi:hypothetical protein
MRKYKQVKFYVNNSNIEFKELLGMCVVDYGEDNNGKFILFELDIQA